MAIWAVGDIHGCYSSFRKLLETIAFDPQNDTLWLVGDIINRGEDSLKSIEYIYSIRQSVVMILGNHDISLIAAYYGIKKPSIYMEPILRSCKVHEYIHWLRFSKFLHIDLEHRHCVAHAGVSPEFDLGMAINYAKMIETKLRGKGAKDWLKEMHTNGVYTFNPNAKESDREKYILGAFTRMRFCSSDSKLDFKQKGKPNPLVIEQKGLKPWFASDSRRRVELKIIFGHWSTLGYYDDGNVVCLDTGCVWGGGLMAYRVDSDTNETVRVECEGNLDPLSEV
jgi:bis(5'-nucleosyl)-tetraphosphatase (symmetrical)